VTKIRDFLRTDDPGRKSALFKTVLAIWVAYIAFLVGTYSTRFRWSGHGWLATTFGSVALALALGILIHAIWKTRDELP
jgi:hypothetical protein